MLLGLVLIAVAVFTFSESTPFPGVAALLPCAGAALAIYGGQSRMGSFVLANPVAVGIGLISYSLYLAHWPVYVFYVAARPGDIYAADSVLIIALSFVFALMLYFFIERPFREGVPRALSTKPALAGIALGTFVAGGTAVSAWADGGWPWRLPPEIRSQIVTDPTTNNEYVWASLRLRDVPFSTKLAGDPQAADARKLLVIGDSMAGDVVNILETSGLTGKSLVRTAIIHAPCQPVISVSGDNYHPKIPAANHQLCDERRAILSADPRVAEADVIILAASWRPWSLDFLPATIQWLGKNGKKEIMLVGAKTMVQTSQEMLMNAFGARLDESYRPANPMPAILKINDILRKISSDQNAKYIDMLGVVCDPSNNCQIFDSDGKLIFFDVMHLTRAGVEYYAGEVTWSQ